MNTTIKKRIEEINSGRVPEGYEKTSFGIFPCDWENKKFHQICDIFSGGTPNTKISEYWDGDIPWCVPTDITRNSKYIWQTERNITRFGLDNSSSIVMPENSILMCSRATIGPRCINKVPMATNQGFKNLVCKKGYDYEFIYYYIDILLKNLLKKSNGSTFLELSKSELEKSECIVPNNCKEQSRIAEILMQWDKAIELQEKYIKQLELRKKALMQRLLTPKEGWKDVKIDEIFEVTRGQVLPVSECNDEYLYPVYSSQTANGGLMGYYNKYLFENAITWTTDGANAGNVNYRKGKFYCTNVCGVLINNEGYANYCIAYLLNLVTKKYVSFVGNPKLMNNVMANITINIPPIEEQKIVSKIMELLDGEIVLHTQKLDKIIEQRKALQQYLLTGIVRV